MELATAFVTIRPETSGFESELASAVGGQTVDVPVGADVEEAQGEIEGLDGGEVAVEVGAVTDPAQQEIDNLDGGTVEVEVGANTDAAQSQIDDLGGSVDGLLGSLGEGGGGATGAMDAFSGAALGAGSAGSIAATGGLAALALGLGASVSAAMESEAVTARLGAILQTTGAGAYLTADSVQALATQIQGYSGQSDEAITSAATLLLTFEGVSNQAAVASGVFERAVTATADIAALMGGDATGAAVRLGRALDDPVAGMTALQRSGVSFTQTQKDTIRALAESGDVLGAQGALLDVVEGQVGGVAAAYGDSLAGKVDKAKEALGNAAEVVGTAMIPALGDLATFLGGAADGFVQLTEDVDGFLEKADSQFMEQSEAWTTMFQRLGLASNGAKGIVDLGDAARETTPEMDALAAAQQAANEAIAGTLPTLGGIISETDRAGAAFGILNASSDPQVIIDNLGLALFAWDDFQSNITQIDDWGPRIAGALQQLGPEVAGGLTNALAEGNAATIVELDGLIAQIEAKGGDASAVLTGFAQSGMDGAVAAVEGASGPMGAAGTAAGASGAAGIDAGLAFSNASNIGQIVGVQYGAGVSSGISAMAGTVQAVASNLFAGVSISSAFSRGQSLGSAYGSGIVAGLASQIGNAAATRASLDAVVESVGASVGRSALASVAPTLPPVQVVLDGQVVAEASFEHNRRLAMAEGYEQP